MKKPVLSAAVIFVFCGILYGSGVDQGRFEAGGMAEFSTTTGSSGLTSFCLFPRLMYYPKWRLAVGGTVGFSVSGNDNLSETSFMFGPAAAYYFDINKSAIFPYVTAGFSYTYVATTTTENGVEYDSEDNTVIVPIGGGIRFLLNDFVALDAGAMLSFGDHTKFAIGAGFAFFIK